ncbi:hypothetical protein [Clostridium sp.]|uniref:hypothetical protein n=1 Tax=Clostridium sp. TaxID=1506 RepID=UPI0028998A3F|nr:hypothetical protein [Clostridium sp.]
MSNQDLFSFFDSNSDFDDFRDRDRDDCRREDRDRCDRDRRCRRECERRCERRCERECRRRDHCRRDDWNNDGGGLLSLLFLLSLL